jgi:penicillin-binding protein 2
MKRFRENLYKIVKNRLFVLTFFICILFFVLFNRIFHLQIIEGQIHEDKFKLRVVRDINLKGYRGKIFDRYGYPLAENKLAYKVVIDNSVKIDNINKVIYDLITVIEKNGDEIVKTFPIIINNDNKFIFSIKSDSQIIRFKKDVFGVKKLNKEQVNMSAEDIFNFLREKRFKVSEQYSEEEALEIVSIRYALWIKRFFKYQPQELAINISDETLAELEENSEKFPGVSIIEDSLRIYNDSKYFAHVIGYTGKIDSDTLEKLKPRGYNAHDIVGKTAVEKEMEVYLQGEDGVQSVEVNSLGRKMNTLNVVQPTAGKDVYLTLDRDLQIKCYDILEKQLAEMIVKKLSMSIPSTGAKSVVLLKDVYNSFFNNGLISIERLENSTNGQYQNIIYRTFLNEYNKVLPYVKESLDVYKLDYNKRLRTYYIYFLNQLNEDGLIVKNYYKSDLYIKFKKDSISFKEMIEKLKDEDLITEKYKDLSNEEIYKKIYNKILNDYIDNYSFKKTVYSKLINNQSFSYINLSMVLVEQGVVKVSDSQLASLKRGSLSPIEFMRQKISNLEITPQQVGQDPSSGAIVITDVNTGEIRATVSYPSYDNNMLVNNFNYKYYLKLLNDPTKPLYPRATQERKAPGSTYKMIVAMAGLEEGIIGRNEIINAIGYYNKIYPAAKCWIYSRGGTHGPINVVQALEVSCNYFFYEVGYRLSIKNGKYIDSKGINILNKYASKFGLDSKTGIEIGEMPSNLAEKDAVRSSIGQGTHNYTPIQLARYIGTLVNGGILYELNIIDNVKNPKGDMYFDKKPAVTLVNDFKPENVETVKKGTYQVTHGSRGSASYYFKDLPIKSAGKTGTAQEATNRPDHALFVSYAPYNEPEIAVVVVIPFGDSSTNAVKTAQKVIESYYRKENTRDVYSYGNLLD